MIESLVVFATVEKNMKMLPHQSVSQAHKCFHTVAVASGPLFTAVPDSASSQQHSMKVTMQAQRVPSKMKTVPAIMVPFVPTTSYTVVASQPNASVLTVTVSA